MAQIVSLGWADEATLRRWAAGIRAWNHDPDALFANLLFETVAWIE